jgi:hypothetical protein
MSRVCAACGQGLDSDEYSSNQWRKGAGISRCKICVAENFDSEDYNSTLRTSNGSRGVNINWDYIIGEGTFRYVALGKYTGGQRTGQSCVAKWFKSGAYDFDDFFNHEIEALKVAARLLKQWNDAAFIDKVVRMNTPDVYTGGRPGKFLVEPYIDNFVKFNSNTGWTSDSNEPWHLVMQALSHFSYHISAGMYLLCDLQGGTYRDGAILTDPVVQSRRREFGPTDLGASGISTFFSRHSCNRFCRANWTKPADFTQYFRISAASSYIPLRQYHFG